MAKLALIPKEKMIRSLVAAYVRAGRRVINILRDLSPEDYSEVAGAIALAQVRSAVIELNATAIMWSSRSIKAAYEEAKTVARMRLEMIGAKKPKRSTRQPDRHTRAINKQAAVMAEDLLKANWKILNTAEKFIGVVAYAARQLQRYSVSTALASQAFSPDEVQDMIDSTVRQALRTTSKYNAGTAHLTSKTIARKIMSKLMGHLEGQDFIVIKGKDGKERNYNLRSYSEMVARTRMREAQSKATIEMCKDYDNDLVQWSQHSEPCPDCALLEGQIFSISGKHPEYPALTGDVEPPLHPNCEHNLNPTSDNALHWRNA